MQPGQDRGNSGLIDTAHIFPGICASLRVAWISHGSADRLHVREAFQLRRKMPCLDAAGIKRELPGSCCKAAPARARLLPGAQILIVPPPVWHSLGPAGDTSRLSSRKSVVWLAPN